MAIRGKTDGAGCAGDKEIKTPSLLPCTSYVAVNNWGENNQARITIFITLMQKYTMKIVPLFMSSQLRSYLSHFTCQTTCLISSNSCKCPFYVLSLSWFKPRCPTKYFHSNFSLSKRKENLVWQIFIVELQYAKYCYTLCVCAVWYKYKLTQALGC